MQKIDENEKAKIQNGTHLQSGRTKVIAMYTKTSHRRQLIIVSIAPCLLSRNIKHPFFF